MALITPKEAYNRKSTSWKILDVRTPREFELVRVPGSINVPIMIKGPKAMTYNRDFLLLVASKFTHDDKIILICGNGSRSNRAVFKLASAGYNNLANVEGGLVAWMNNRNLPTK